MLLKLVLYLPFKSKELTMKKLPRTSLLLSTLLFSGVASTTAQATVNPFALVELDNGYMQLAEAESRRDYNGDNEYERREYERREYERRERERQAREEYQRNEEWRKRQENKHDAHYNKKWREGQCGTDHERKSREGKCGSRPQHERKHHHKRW
jgi:uncharacterized low-complexity protein